MLDGLSEHPVHGAGTEGLREIGNFAGVEQWPRLSGLWRDHKYRHLGWSTGARGVGGLLGGAQHYGVMVS